MFYSYTRSEHKNMLDRFFIHQINALSSCCYLSEVFVAEKRHGLCKSYSEKREKKLRKNGHKSVRDIENNGYLDARLEKREKMNKIASVVLQKYFQVSKERYVFKEQSRIRLATTYIYLIYPHTCTSWFDCMTHFSLSPLFDFTIHALQVCSSFLPTYELHINLSCRKRKRA